MKIREIETSIKNLMLKKPEDMVDKTIRKIYGGLDRHLGLRFSDGTFIVLKAYDYDENCFSINVETELSNTSIVWVGLDLITKDGWEEYWKLKAASSRDSTRAWRKKQYLELKKEFEGE